ncbi:MAG: hypothetical protein IKG81_09390 [Bacteroidales bacterium]|nr:hypothetical protein [Bacteroidales bacterium]
MHYVIIGLIIVYILYKQFTIFNDTRKRLDTFGDIFPDSLSEEYKVGKRGVILVIDTEESINKEIQRIDNEIDKTADLAYLDLLRSERRRLSQLLYNITNRKTNSVWDKILSSINRYLEKNKGSVSDFHLIKDIVDRNCDAEEEAIQTQVPMPLYYGLMGTMAGIIVGVGYLWLSGGLKALLSMNPQAGVTSADGIVALLGGVALAMICSIFGIFLTTNSSSRLKDVKITFEERKHKFLSWMQAELLPKLNNDFADAMTKMTSNLSRFNETFSENADKLRSTLSIINQATNGQAQILSAIDNLKISKIATANIEVYDKLKNCSDEIGMLSKQLEISRQYLEEVRTLNDKLDASEQRTRTIEDMALFFKEERGNIGAMQSVLNQAIGDIQTNLRQSIESLKEESAKQIFELVAHNTEQRQRLQAAINDQETILQQKTAEINRLIDNLSSVEKMVKTLDSSANKQTNAISSLAKDIRDLATQKVSGTIMVKPEKMPKWTRTLIIIGGSIVTAYCLLSLTLWILNLINVL